MAELGLTVDTPCEPWLRQDGTPATTRGMGWTPSGLKASRARVAWETANGTIPDGLHVLHRCDNPPCCNLNHLFLGTRSDNMRDARMKGRVRSERNLATSYPAELALLIWIFRLGFAGAFDTEDQAA